MPALAETELRSQIVDLSGSSQDVGGAQTSMSNSDYKLKVIMDDFMGKAMSSRLIGCGDNQSMNTNRIEEIHSRLSNTIQFRGPNENAIGSMEVEESTEDWFFEVWKSESNDQLLLLLNHDIEVTRFYSFDSEIWSDAIVTARPFNCPSSNSATMTLAPATNDSVNNGGQAAYCESGVLADRKDRSQSIGILMLTYIAEEFHGYTAGAPRNEDIKDFKLLESVMKHLINKELEKLQPEHFELHTEISEFAKGMGCS